MPKDQTAKAHRPLKAAVGGTNDHRSVPPAWNLSAVLRCNPETGAILSASQTFAWGPDLSGTENGAGGIGGLAIYVDDFNDGGGGSGAIGVMFPIYDGNGNILRLLAGSVNTSTGVPNEKAEYRYGPFGEDRGRTGPQASRFPFRWSTKFTDNETGLVYYGYRYYSASLGRWVSRDPRLEQGGFNTASFVRNDPIRLADSLGLRPISLEFDAFINGARRGHWLPEPGIAPIFPFLPVFPRFAWEFSTDWRDFGRSNHNSFAPNSRLMSRTTIESSRIGSGHSLIAGLTTAGTSHRRYSRVARPGDGPAPIFPEEDLTGVETATADVLNSAPIESTSDEDIADRRDAHRRDKCQTIIKFNPSGTYPFMKTAPSIDYKVYFVLRVESPGWVTIGIAGEHNDFPDYEAYVDDGNVWGWSAPGTGPGLNLTTSTAIGNGRYDVNWRISVQAETPCGCP